MRRSDAGHIAFVLPRNASPGMPCPPSSLSRLRHPSHLSSVAPPALDAAVQPAAALYKVL